MELVNRYRPSWYRTGLGHCRSEPQRYQTPRITLDDVARVGLLADIETLYLDRGYDFPKIRAQLAGMGLDDLNIQKRKPRGIPRQKQRLRLGLRWVVEGTTSWLLNYGQLRRNTDRRNDHRHAQLCLVTILLITAKLIDWRKR